MMTIFRYAFSRSRGSVLGWGVGLFLLGMLIVPLFGTIVDQQEELLTLLESYPPELSAFFGDFKEFATPEGYLAIEYFSYMPLVLGIFAVINGSGMLAADEEAGRLDLVLAHPVSRTGLLLGRLLALIIATLLILVIAWLGLVLQAASSEVFDISPGRLALPFLSLFAVLLLFSSLSLFLSMLLPARRMAALLSGVLLVASFFITSLARLSEPLEAVAKLSPLDYYQGAEAISSMNWSWLGGLVGFSVLFVLAAWWLFKIREIRVSGEGTWPLLSRVVKRKARV